MDKDGYFFYQARTDRGKLQRFKLRQQG